MAFRTTEAKFFRIVTDEHDAMTGLSLADLLTFKYIYWPTAEVAGVNPEMLAFCHGRRWYLIVPGVKWERARNFSP